MKTTWLVAFCVIVSACATGGRPRRAPDQAGPTASSQPGSVRADTREELDTPPQLAQPQSIGSLSLERALAAAEELHPDLTAARARVEAAEGRTTQAGLYPNPVGVFRMESAPFRGRTTGDAEYVAGVSVPLDVAGRTAAARRAADVDRERAIEEVEAIRSEVRARVEAAFAAALYAEQALEVQAEARELSKRGVAVTRALLAAGEAIPGDLARSELEMVDAEHEMQRAKALRDLAAIRLASAMGEPSLRIELIEGSLEAALEVPSLESTFDRIGEHPAVRAADTAVEAYRARISLVEAERIPDVNLDLFYRRLEHSEENAFDVGISVPIPIFDRNQGRLAEARAETAAAQAQARSIRNGMVERLMAAHEMLTRAVNSTRLLREEVIPRAETVLKTAEARYAAGDIRLLEVIAARREYLELRLSYLEVLRDMLEAWSMFAPFLEEAPRGD